MNRREYLDDRLDALLARLTPPARMQPQAQLDETAALGRALDRLAPSSGWEAWWTRFEDALLALATTRAWPLVGDLERAASRLRERDTETAKAAAGTDEPEYLYAMVEEWWLKHRNAGPGSVPKEHHAKRLVDANLATWGELRRKGFPIPLWAKPIAMAEHDPNHEAILDDIHATGDRLRGAPRGSLADRHPIYSGLE